LVQLGAQALEKPADLGGIGFIRHKVFGTESRAFGPALIATRGSPSIMEGRMLREGMIPE